MKGIPKELKDYKVIKTIQGLSGKSISELNGHYMMNIWSEEEFQIVTGFRPATAIRFHITEQPWEDESTTIIKAA